MRRIDNIMVGLTIAKLRENLKKYNVSENQFLASLDPNFKKEMCETKKCLFNHNPKLKGTCEDCAKKWLEEELFKGEKKCQ